VRIAIVGSRRFKSRKKVIDLVNSLPQETVIVTGGCRGPDTWAEYAAKKRGLKTTIFRPKLPPDDSPRYEFIKAYYERNRKIAQNADMLHAFVSSDRTGGTENTIRHAKELNIPVITHYE
jgi:predicted Rossmann fold nucleotide-binding protein DprA/Smf involved in DNA uptake